MNENPKALRVARLIGSSFIFFTLSLFALIVTQAHCEYKRFSYNFKHFCVTLFIFSSCFIWYIYQILHNSYKWLCYGICEKIP